MSDDWRKHDGGPNPAPGQNVSLKWGIGIIDNEPSDKVNWSLKWTWKPTRKAIDQAIKEGGG